MWVQGAYLYLNGGDLAGVQKFSGWKMGPFAQVANYAKYVGV